MIYLTPLYFGERGVAERLGYLQESVERGGGRGLGGFYDIVVYAMLADEWRSRA